MSMGLIKWYSFCLVYRCGFALLFYFDFKAHCYTFLYSFEQLWPLPVKIWLIIGLILSTVGLFQIKVLQGYNQSIQKHSLDSNLFIIFIYPTTSFFSSLRCRFTLRGHADSVNTIEFLPFSNTLLSSSADKTVSLWDARTVRIFTFIPFFQNCFTSILMQLLFK